MSTIELIESLGELAQAWIDEAHADTLELDPSSPAHAQEFAVAERTRYNARQLTDALQEYARKQLQAL